MNDLNVIDRFTQVFSQYIDSGFGLLVGDVAFLTGILVALDIVLAGLFWALALRPRPAKERKMMSASEEKLLSRNAKKPT